MPNQPLSSPWGSFDRCRKAARGGSAAPWWVSTPTEGPAAGVPRLTVEGVPAVEDASLRDDPAERDRVQLPVLPPLGEHQDGVGALGGLLRGLGIVQLRPQPPAVVDRGR